MGVLKFLGWTACAVALGVWLASGEIDGRTPLDHVKGSLDGIGAVASPVREVLEDAHDAVVKNPAAPRERHSEKDRKALDDLISQRAGKQNNQR